MISPCYSHLGVAPVFPEAFDIRLNSPLGQLKAIR